MLILIDGNYLANRAFHSVGHLTNDDIPTGVPFGMFVEAALLVERFNCDRLAWCFDRGRSRRVGLWPGYKASRQADPVGDPAKYAQRMAVHAAVKDMATRVLPSVGYKSIWHAKGFEADDIIARYCIDNRHEPIVVVSADSDLYQLLTLPWVTVYSPQTKKLWDADAFEESKGVPPEMWIDVKAIAGCDSDDVPGVKGVGDKTAIAWLLGNLNPTTKAAKAIEAFVASNQATLNRNLVKLPFAGTPSFVYSPDDVTPDKWDAMRAAMGFNEAHIPIPKLLEGVPLVIERRPQTDQW